MKKVRGFSSEVFPPTFPLFNERANQVNTSQLCRFAGWSAYVTAVADIIGFVSLSVFYAVGGPAG